MLGMTNARRRDNNETCANAVNEKIYVKMSVFCDKRAVRNDIFATFAQVYVIWTDCAKYSIIPLYIII